MTGILIVGTIGLIAGLVLAISSIVFAVPVDEMVEVLTGALPGVNCGACGYSGCAGYAKAMAEKTAPVGFCSPGGADVARETAEILGEAAEAVERKVAVVMCQGHCDNVETKLEYEGIDSCAAASLMYGGDSACNFGCLGKGDCAAICPENAIAIVNGLAVVKTALCIGCKLCEKECPKRIITILPEKFNQHVRCMNTDKGVITRKICTTGCIGCMKCKKVCEFDAITIKDFCATMDYDKCTNCGKCVEVCPVHAIA